MANKYREMKAKIREQAIVWQVNFANENRDYGYLAEWGEYFYKQGKRYGLLKEFRENGIC